MSFNLWSLFFLNIILRFRRFCRTSRTGWTCRAGWTSWPRRTCRTGRAGWTRWFSWSLSWIIFSYSFPQFDKFFFRQALVFTSCPHNGSHHLLIGNTFCFCNIQGIFHHNLVLSAFDTADFASFNKLVYRHTLQNIVFLIKVINYFTHSCKPDTGTDYCTDSCTFKT